MCRSRIRLISIRKRDGPKKRRELVYRVKRSKKGWRWREREKGEEVGKEDTGAKGRERGQVGEINQLKYSNTLTKLPPSPICPVSTPSLIPFIILWFFFDLHY
jgi:hypothetical protein